MPGAARRVSGPVQASAGKFPVGSGDAVFVAGAVQDQGVGAWTATSFSDQAPGGVALFDLLVAVLGIGGAQREQHEARDQAFGVHAFWSAGVRSRPLAPA